MGMIIGLLGIIGCGNIGSIVAERAIGLKMKVAAYDPFLSPERALNIGVDKVILGSAAIKNPNFLKEACEKFKNKIVLGLDAKKKMILISGWKETTDQTAENYLKKVNSYGFSRLIYTDIERDGTKTGPNIDETKSIAKISAAPVVVSGGISTIQDVKKIKELKNFNIEGAIVGKAIYDGDIKLNEFKQLENA